MSYWRGNGINVLKIAPETALKFMAYEQVKQRIKGNTNRELTIYERFVAGSLAGGLSQTAIYPLEVTFRFDVVSFFVSTYQLNRLTVFLIKCYLFHIF